MCDREGALSEADLVRDELVCQVHGQMEDATDWSHALGELDQLLGLLRNTHIQGGHLELQNAVLGPISKGLDWWKHPDAAVCCYLR